MIVVKTHADLVGVQGKNVEQYRNGNLMKVLILGNGISRLLYYDFILNWKNEIWACNFAFKEFGHILNRLTGHGWVMEEAEKEKIKRGWKFEIWCGDFPVTHKKFTVNERFLSDSGTTLVAQALEENYEVYLCGFDLGGFDILSPGKIRRKDHWVRRWHSINKWYGLNSVEFIGHDHKVFIENGGSTRKYSRDYVTNNQPHIPGEEYQDLFYRFQKMRDIDPTYKGDQYVEYALNGGSDV